MADTTKETKEIKTISVDYSRENGSIYPTPPADGKIKVPAGTTVTLTFIPNTNYFINAMKIDGSGITPVHEYSFPDIDSDHSVSIDFIQIKENKNGALLRKEMSAVVENTLMFIEKNLKPDIKSLAPLGKLRYDLLDIDKMLRTLFGYVDKLSTESNLK